MGLRDVAILCPNPGAWVQKRGFNQGALVPEGDMLDRFQYSNKNNKGNRDLSVGKIHESKYL